MLELISFSMKAVPRYIKLPREICLDQTMMTDDLKSNFSSCAGQFNPLIRFVNHPKEICQFLQHSSDRSRRTAKGKCKHRGGNMRMVQFQGIYFFKIMFVSNSSHSEISQSALKTNYHNLGNPKYYLIIINKIILVNI